MIGFCKLRSKHISDLTLRKDQCKDRAVFDVPRGSTTSMTPKSERTLFSEREAAELARLEKARQASPTFSQTAAKQEPKAEPAKIVVQKAEKKVPAKPEPKAAQKQKEPEPPKPVQQPAQVVPPMKLTPQDAIKLLEQQQSGKINARLSKYGNEDKGSAERDLIRKAVWGGGA